MSETIAAAIRSDVFTARPSGARGGTCDPACLAGAAPSAFAPGGSDTAAESRVRRAR
jgi:hypothetical protein